MSLFHTTIPTRHVGIESKHGQILRVLPAGRHARAWRTTVTRVDLRESLHQMTPQEVQTADGVQVRATAVIRWSVADAVAFTEVSTDPLAVVHLAAQMALRSTIAAMEATTIASHRGSEVGATLTESVAAVATMVGIGVHEVVLRDVILPAEVRAAAAQVVAARQIGAARLEAARAETAALRSLANGAKILEDHPALARLRMVEAAPPGSQIVLSMDGTATTRIG